MTNYQTFKDLPLLGKLRATCERLRDEVIVPMKNDFETIKANLERVREENRELEGAEARPRRTRIRRSTRR